MNEPDTPTPTGAGKTQAEGAGTKTKGTATSGKMPLAHEMSLQEQYFSRGDPESGSSSQLQQTAQGGNSPVVNGIGQPSSTSATKKDKGKEKEDQGESSSTGGGHPDTKKQIGNSNEEDGGDENEEDGEDEDEEDGEDEDEEDGEDEDEENSEDDLEAQRSLRRKPRKQRQAAASSGVSTGVGLIVAGLYGLLMSGSAMSAAIGAQADAESSRAANGAEGSYILAASAAVVSLGTIAVGLYNVIDEFAKCLGGE